MRSINIYHSDTLLVFYVMHLKVTQSNCDKSRHAPARTAEKPLTKMSVAENSSEMSHSQPSVSEEVDSQEDQPTLVHPWPYLEEFFEMVGCKNNSFRMRCKLCAPKYHELMAFKNSPSNLKKHIEVS